MTKSGKKAEENVTNNSIKSQSQVTERKIKGDFSEKIVTLW